MKVMKFGGTSVGSVQSILSVKRIVEAAEGPVIVVVSALGGITDKLINTSRMAASGDAAYEQEFREIVTRHVEMVKRVIPEFDAQMAVQRKVGELLNELKDIFQGIYLIKDLSQKTSDTIVSYGERLSSIIAAELTGAQWYDSRRFIKTEKKFSKHVLDTELTNRLVRETFSTLPPVALVPGFIATDKDTGDVTNLGRGGSDYTAAIIAAALEADSLEIWTDVDGFMTADPRVISTAYTISELSYVEATELCNFGAKVVYPPTIYPVCHKNIPVLIKNTFNPEAAGTIIKQEADHSSKAIKGISSINDTCLITMTGLGMVGVIGVNYRIFKEISPAMADDYLQLLMMDAFCLNADRHTENYGVLRDIETGGILSLAPNFDNNISLLYDGYKPQQRMPDLLGRELNDLERTEHALSEYAAHRPLPMITPELIEECCRRTEMKVDVPYVQQFVMAGYRQTLIPQMLQEQAHSLEP